MNNDNQHIPSGYKPSPLGIIPEDWEVKRLGEITTKIGSGITPRGGQNVYVTNGHPFMRSQNVSNGHLLLDDIVYIDDSTHQKQISTEIKPYDVLLNITGASIGRCAVAEESIVGGNVNQHVCIIRLKNKNLSYYVCSFLLSYLGQKQVDSFQAGGNREGLNYDQISSFKICVPPLNEIDQITNILSLWDTAIAKQTALIEQLTLRKRGLMQQLLTGKKRLKGFEGKWKEMRLGDCGKFLNNNTLSREQLNERNGTVQNIHYGDVLIKYPSILDCDKVTLPFINESAYKDSMMDFVKNGDIVISDTAEDETVGKACEVQNIGTNRILAGLHTMLFRPDEGLFSPFFLGYYINSEVYHSKLIPLIQGIKVCSIGKQAIQNTIVIIPSIDEQNAIASVLVNADKEIEIQKQKLAAMQEQKKGLMQVLLTGKKRIK